MLHTSRVRRPPHVCFRTRADSWRMRRRRGGGGGGGGGGAGSRFVVVGVLRGDSKSFFDLTTSEPPSGTIAPAKRFVGASFYRPNDAGIVARKPSSE